jgi:hypothetical protein
MPQTNDELTVPTLHLNGSGYDNLYGDYREALQALQDAKDKLPRPHGRDYYVQDDQAFTKAREQFNAQMTKLREVEEELTAILMNVLEQHRA